MLLIPIASAVASYAIVYWIDRRLRPALLGGAAGGLIGTLFLLLV